MFVVNSKVLSESDAYTIFSNVADLAKHHEAMLLDLQRNLSDWKDTSVVGSVFKEKVRNFHFSCC